MFYGLKQYFQASASQKMIWLSVWSGNWTYWRQVEVGFFFTVSACKVGVFLPINVLGGRKDISLNIGGINLTDVLVQNN